MNFEEKYKIVKNNNKSYDLIFYYAVKTTSIFCKPSCKSKLPKKENVEFFNSREDAIKHGYRACKRCRSDLNLYEPSKELVNKLRCSIDKSFAKSKFLNNEIKKLGISSKRMNEIFKDEYKVTPNQYINILRIKLAKELIINTNDKIVDIAYAVGYNSVSVFYRVFKETENMTPTLFRKYNR